MVVLQIATDIMLSPNRKWQVSNFGTLYVGADRSWLKRPAQRRVNVVEARDSGAHGRAAVPTPRSSFLIDFAPYISK